MPLAAQQLEGEESARGWIEQTDTKVPEEDNTARGVLMPEVANVFYKVPLDVLDLLSNSARLTMVEYKLVRDSLIDVTNNLEGLSHLNTLSDSYMEVQLTPSSTLQIKIFKDRTKQSVIMTIYTVGNDETAMDSDVQLFDADFKPLDTRKLLKRPDLKDFFEIPKGSLTTYKEIEQMIPFPTYQFVAGEGDDVTAKLTIGQAVSQDDLKILQLFLRPGVTYRWDGKQLKEVKR